MLRDILIRDPLRRWEVGGGRGLEQLTARSACRERLNTTALARRGLGNGITRFLNRLMVVTGCVLNGDENSGQVSQAVIPPFHESFADALSDSPFK